MISSPCFEVRLSYNDVLKHVNSLGRLSVGIERTCGLSVIGSCGLEEGVSERLGKELVLILDQMPFASMEFR